MDTVHTFGRIWFCGGGRFQYGVCVFAYSKWNKPGLAAALIVLCWWLQFEALKGRGVGSIVC